MNNSSKWRKGFIHLYNPKSEGIGTYDVHYINAYTKNKIRKEESEAIKVDRRRHAA